MILDCFTSSNECGWPRARLGLIKGEGPMRLSSNSTVCGEKQLYGHKLTTERKMDDTSAAQVARFLA